jgi:hypothetical protein
MPCEDKTEQWLLYLRWILRETKNAGYTNITDMPKDILAVYLKKVKENKKVLCFEYDKNKNQIPEGEIIVLKPILAKTANPTFETHKTKNRDQCEIEYLLVDTFDEMINSEDDQSRIADILNELRGEPPSTKWKRFTRFFKRN